MANWRRVIFLLLLESMTQYHAISLDFARKNISKSAVDSFLRLQTNQHSALDTAVQCAEEEICHGFLYLADRAYFLNNDPYPDRPELSNMPNDEAEFLMKRGGDRKIRSHRCSRDLFLHGFGYSRYMLELTAYNWTEAVAQCRHLNGGNRLAYINSAEEMTFLKGMLEQMIQPVFVGLKFDGIEWRWMNSPVGVLDPTFWAPQAPFLNATGQVGLLDSTGLVNGNVTDTFASICECYEIETWH